MLLAIGLAFQAAAAAAVEPRVKVFDHEFVVTATDESGRVAEMRTDRVPNRPGICYRWSLRVKPEHRFATIQERFELPAGAPAWNVPAGSGTIVSEDGRTADTTLSLPLAGGTIGHQWCISEGDPDGHHRITVSAAGHVLHRFEFVVGTEPLT